MWEPQVWGNARVAPCFWYGLEESKEIHGESSPPLSSSVADITAAALATGACIVGILCLPLILLLIYKQRQAASSRRTYPPLAIHQRGHPSHLLGCIRVAFVGWDVSHRSQWDTVESHGHRVRWPKDRSLPGASYEAVLGRARLFSPQKRH